MRQETFFKQSSSDAFQDYAYACSGRKTEIWDWIVLTAADEKQADAYRIQIEKRKAEKWLPAGTRTAVVPDYRNERIGSGGATLNVLRVLIEEDGLEQVLDSRILVIHSGGDSRRIPQYSACGKLFAPVPKMLPGGHVSALFDELLILASGIAGRTGKGIMIFPSDTELLFNSLQLDLFSCDAAGLSMKASVAEGKEHGVFLSGKESQGGRNASRFLHKLSEQALREAGAVDDRDQVDIDTGCIWLGRRVVSALCGLFCTGSAVDIRKFETYVNPDVCLNFYADFVYPLAEDAVLEEFLQEAPENGMSEELLSCRSSIWEKLHGYQLALVKMAPARYIHFGMTHELYDLYVNDMDAYSYLGWNKRVNSNAQSGTVINSYVSKAAVLSEKTLIENSLIKADTCIGDGTILSNVETAGCQIPEDTVLSGIRLENGRYVCRIYAREDNPKASGNAPFLGGSIEKLIRTAGIPESEIWAENPASIWNAAIYPEKDSMEEAVKSALFLYELMSGTAGRSGLEDWKKSKKHSMSSSFCQADVHFLLDWQEKVRWLVKMEQFLEALSAGCGMSLELDRLCGGCTVFEITKIMEETAAKAQDAGFPDNMRLYLAASDICRKYLKQDAQRANQLEDKAYEAVRDCICAEVSARFSMDWHTASIQENRAVAELPVRVNFCGSPSDAAPYCLEHGGTMIDGALLLNGKKPVRAEAEKIKEGIILESADQGNRLCAGGMHEIRDCRNPSDPFALHKAVLIATGLIPMADDVSMEEFCKRIGGGIRLETQAQVPKGSGLGTSSILAAAAIRAIHRLFGEKPADEMIHAQVFLAEQLMNTGGGWQDQAGSLAGGISCLTSAPGTYQKIESEILELSDAARYELNERFALIFSGQRRLARNVLREEMNQCIRNDPAALDAVKKIQECCALMRHYLLKGNITEFAKYMTKQFELVKVLDKGASNTCIEYIFDVIDGLIDGKSICGAGGGGFLQVILKKGVSKEQLKSRIAEEFAECGVEVWDCELV